MKRELATAALEQAVQDRMSHLLDMLCTPIGEPQAAVDRFVAGFNLLLNAHTVAEEVIKNTITE